MSAAAALVPQVDVTSAAAVLVLLAVVPVPQVVMPVALVLPVDATSVPPTQVRAVLAPQVMLHVRQAPVEITVAEAVLHRT